LILAWADSHKKRTGRWPRAVSGPVVGGPPGENWLKVDKALRRGLRGLPGGWSLPQLLAKRRGVPNSKGQPPLAEEQILAWADASHGRTGDWPRINSGAIKGARGESWRKVDAALVHGRRGLPGGSSLARLLAARRAARYLRDLPPLSVEGVLA